MIEPLSKRTLEKLDAMIKCSGDPKSCLKENCPCYNIETQGCGAYGVVQVLRAHFTEKFKGVTKDEE